MAMSRAHLYVFSNVESLDWNPAGAAAYAVAAAAAIAPAHNIDLNIFIKPISSYSTKIANKNSFRAIMLQLYHCRDPMLTNSRD